MMLSCGDALVDFLPVEAVDGRDALVPVVGGSCLNIAVGMARLGAPAGFVGGISTDLFGRMIADHALASQVELRYATRSEHQTTLAFVRTVAGEPQYAFYDEGTASRQLDLSQRLAAVRSGSRRSMSARRPSSTSGWRPRPSPWWRRRAGRSPSLSIRTVVPTWWATSAATSSAWRPLPRAAHIVRMSDVDFDYLYGDDDPARRAAALIAAGASLMIVTRGAQGPRPGTRRRDPW